MSVDPRKKLFTYLNLRIPSVLPTSSDILVHQSPDEGVVTYISYENATYDFEVGKCKIIVERLSKGQT